jgi:hypothetical protein
MKYEVTSDGITLKYKEKSPIGKPSPLVKTEV